MKSCYIEGVAIAPLLPSILYHYLAALLYMETFVMVTENKKTVFMYTAVSVHASHMDL